MFKEKDRPTDRQTHRQRDIDVKYTNILIHVQETTFFILPRQQTTSF